MSGVGKRTRPPNIDKILQSKKFNPSTDFPEDLLDKIFLCDRDAPKPEEYEEQLDRHPIEKPFPQFDPPYEDTYNNKEYYHDKEDRKALNDKRVSDLAKIEELRKRKKRMNELENIYKDAREKFEELKAAQSTRGQKSYTDEIQKIMDKNKDRLDSTDDENSNDMSSDHNDESEDNDIDRYESYDEEEPRERRKTYHEKTSRPARTKSDKKIDSKKKKTPQFHEPNKEKNYQLVKNGKITSLPFVEEVYNQQKSILDNLKQMNSNSKSEENLKKIEEQENKVNIVHKILKQLSIMPESPSMAPDNTIKPEKLREYDLYQKKLDLAQKEIERENSLNVHQDKFESASSTANAIDESFKDVFGDDDGDSNSSDSDGDLFN